MITKNNVYELFFFENEVVEIRGLGLSGKTQAWEGWPGNSGVVYGYSDNAVAFENAAKALDNAGATGVYFTLNPCAPELIARANNRLVAAGKRPLTSDSNIKCIRWFFIDIDPKRPAGISSSDNELEAARKTGKKIVSWLREELDFPAFIGACSGNGYHILYRLPDLEPSDSISGSKGLIANALRVLDERFGDQDISIDVSVHNPARICKLYGTMARKGDHTEERPHRRSYLLKKNPQSFNETPILSLEKLQKLASMCSRNSEERKVNNLVGTTVRGATTRPMHPNDLGSLDVEAYLNHYSVKIRQIKEYAGATFYCLENCVFNADHRGGEAAIVVSPEPPHLTYQCFHTSCKDKRWRDARACISGDDAIARFFSNYDPDWRPATAVGKGILSAVEVSFSSSVTGSTDIPSPEKIDPKEFYQRRGKREVFTVALMAKYLAIYLNPICHTDGVFWKYDAGLWAPFKKSKIHNIVHHALKDRIQTAYYKNSCEALAALTNREEDEWPVFRTLVNLANGIYDLENK